MRESVDNRLGCTAVTPGRRVSRNVGLDVARSAAILMVFVSHLATAGGGWSPRADAVLQTMGQAGVELFFSLSGFLIGGILVRLDRDGFGLLAVMRFMVRRWFRTLPLYYLVLVAVGVWFGMDIRHSLLLVQNFHPTEPRAIPASWSLVMEEYFYLAFPLLMLALHGMGARRGRLVGWTALLLILCCSVLRLWNAYGFGPGWPAPFVHENPLLRLDCAAFGAVAAWLTHGLSLNHPGRAPRLVISGLLLAAAASALLVWVLGATVESLVRHGFLWWGPAFLAMQATVDDAAFALLVVGLAGLTFRLPRPLGSTVQWVSLTSYSVYLLHMPVIGYFTVPAAAQVGALNMAQGAALETIVTAAVATATYFLIEKPFLRQRDTWLPDGKQAVKA
jgi:peptidoglycan/LPS O-acetylase OafA/YrhL